MHLYLQQNLYYNTGNGTSCYNGNSTKFFYNAEGEKLRAVQQATHYYPYGGILVV